MHWYMVTIKSRGKAATSKQELDSFYEGCKHNFKGMEWSEYKCYELKNYRLHLHTWFSGNIAPWCVYTLLKKVNTPRMYIHLDEFPSYDINKVRSYITKRKFEEYEILIKNDFYNSNYQFPAELKA